MKSKQEGGDIGEKISSRDDHVSVCRIPSNRMKAWARYYDGTEVRVGDWVKIADQQPRQVYALYPSDHEVSILYGMTNGCIGIWPATVDCNPLDGDTILISRGEWLGDPNL